MILPSHPKIAVISSALPALPFFDASLPFSSHFFKRPYPRDSARANTGSPYA
jgi:hypothetical protein